MTRPAFRLRAVTVIAALVGTAMVVAGLGKPTNPNVAIGERFLALNAADDVRACELVVPESKAACVAASGTRTYGLLRTGEDGWEVLRTENTRPIDPDDENTCRFIVSAGKRSNGARERVCVVLKFRESLVLPESLDSGIHPCGAPNRLG